MDRFEVEARDRFFKPYRILFLPPAALAWTFLEVRLTGHWPDPGGCTHLLAMSFIRFLVLSCLLCLELRRELVVLKLEGDTIIVHTALGMIPLLGETLGVRRFPRSSWRISVLHSGLLLGKPSADPAFRWGAERNFKCSKETAARLKTWLRGRLADA